MYSIISYDKILLQPMIISNINIVKCQDIIKNKHFYAVNAIAISSEYITIF